MTIDTISDSLPNGFHDADICRIHIDYVKEEALFLIDIDLSSPEEKVEAPSRQGELKLTGLLYLELAQDSLYNPLWDLEGDVGRCRRRRAFKRRFKPLNQSAVGFQ